MEIYLLIGLFILIAYSIGKSKGEQNILSDIKNEENEQRIFQRNLEVTNLKHELKNLENEYVQYYLAKGTLKKIDKQIGNIISINNFKEIRKDVLEKMLKNKDSIILTLDNEKNEDYLNGKYSIKRLILSNIENELHYITIIKVDKNNKEIIFIQKIKEELFEWLIEVFNIEKSQKEEITLIRHSRI